MRISFCLGFVVLVVCHSIGFVVLRIFVLGFVVLRFVIAGFVVLGFIVYWYCCCRGFVINFIL